MALNALYGDRIPLKTEISTKDLLKKVKAWLQRNHYDPVNRDALLRAINPDRRR